MADTPKFKLISMTEEQWSKGGLDPLEIICYDFISLQEDKIIISILVDYNKFETKDDLIIWIKEKLLEKYETELKVFKQKKDEFKKKETLKLEIDMII